jgi:hypothetical protein
MSYPGAMAALANLGDNEASISASTRGVEAKLFTGEIDDVNFDYIGRTIRITGPRQVRQAAREEDVREVAQQEAERNRHGSVGRVGLSGKIAMAVT